MTTGPKVWFITGISRGFGRSLADALLSGASRERLAAMAGKQPGNPARAAAAIIQAVDSSKPPLHLVLGSDAYHRTRQMLEAFSTELDTWKDAAIGADYEA